MRRKRYQHGCVRKVKHGRRWVWIGKYYEDCAGRTKVLGACADLTEGGAWAKLQEFLQPVNETAGMRNSLPTNFRAYVTNVYLPQRRKKWKESTDQTTTERFQSHLFSAFENFDLADIKRDRLQKFLDAKARSGLSKAVVAHLRWDLNAIFKMAADDALIEGDPAGSLVVPREARTTERKRNMTEDEIALRFPCSTSERASSSGSRFSLACGPARSWRSDGAG